DSADLLRREPPVAQRRAGRQTIGRRRDRAEAEDCARGADHALEAAARDLVEVLADLGVDVTNELPLVARVDRVALDEALRQPDDAELEALPELDGRAGASRDFDAPAADVDHDDFTGHADAVHGSQMDEPRFLG